MKTFLTLTFLTIVYWQTCCAQFNDNFADNDFSNAPAWTGNESKFGVIANQLKLVAPAETSTAYLATPSLSINNASWELFLQMDFNPSSTNLAHIYLVSDQQDLSGALQGYFVKVGNTADEVSLYRQDGTTEIKIIDGLDVRLNVSVVKAKVKITRDAVGNWQLFSDVGLTGLYSLEGTTLDNTYSKSGFFGVSCKYTSTRSDKLIFDDFTVTGDAFIDSQPPTVQTIKALSPTMLEVTFSEAVTRFTAETPTYYFVNKGIGSALSATLNADGKTVVVSFDKNFPNGITCNVSISGVQDLAGNQLLKTDHAFLFFKPMSVKWKDIVITEIMADPNPPVGLPNAEFIEVMNKSTAPIDLANWKFAEGNTPEKFSTYILQPGEYLVFMSSSNAPLFKSYGNVMPLTNFPTQNNSSDIIVLKNADGITIDSVSYNDTWYNNDDKKQGGWTLELIDPVNTCAEGNNWLASEDDIGGTPGKQNSVFANKPDLTGPKLLNAIATSPTSIVVTFNEKLERSLPNVTSFTIEPTMQVQEISFTDPSLTAITVKTKEPLHQQESYVLTLEKIYDCAGNTLQAAFNAAVFGLPEKPDSLDVVINEILFNPRPTGVDFVEVYNRSPKYINFKNWSLANLENGILLNAKTISTTDLLLKPFSYQAFTPNIDVVKGEYPQAQNDNYIQIILPAMNDDSGSVALLDENKNIVDAFFYTSALHSIFIKDAEGVSLERIAFDSPTNDQQNWKSASSTVGFATPGYINSNTRLNTGTVVTPENVWVEPEIFIPLYGKPDFAEINYTFGQGGNLANVVIYDTEGRQIKQVANNEVLGTSGFFRWDGDLDNGSKANVGYYVVSFEIVNASGGAKVFRKRVVVATEF